LIAGILGLVFAAPPEVVIAFAPESSPLAEPAARHLRDRLPDPPLILNTTTARDLPLLLRELEARQIARFAVVLAPDRGLVAVIRVEDGTALSRFLDPAAQRSAFAVAVSAAELLELARRPAGTPGAPEMEPLVPPRWSWLIGAFASLGTAPGDPPVLFEPVFSLRLIRYGEGESWWWSIGARGSLAVASQRDFTIGAEVFHTEYTRRGGELNLGLGLSNHPIDVGVTVSGALSWVHVEVDEDATDIRVADEVRLEPWVALGAELRYRSSAHLGFSVAVSVGLVPAPARYLIRDQPALEEAAVRGQAMMGLFWESG
jgi:hypothetical protein